MKVKFLIFVMLVLLMVTQCSVFNKKDDDNNKNAVLALALIPSSCNLGDEEFIIINGNITCANNEASGTGTLIATTEKEFVSLKVDGTLNAEDSEIVIIGAADSSLSGSGFRFGRNLAKAFHPDGTAGGVNMTSGFAPTSTTFTHCVEIHTEERPPHLLAWRNNCPSAGQTTADYNSEEDTSPGGSLAKKGERWGIQLKNAKVSITVNPDEIFEHE